MASFGFCHYCSRDEMKKGEMGRTCGTFRREEKCIRGVWWVYYNERKCVENRWL